MDVWKDLYYECIRCDKMFKEQIKILKKEIEQLQKDIKKNEKFFQENFKLPLDKCIEKSYNEYIKRKEEW